MLSFGPPPQCVLYLGRLYASTAVNVRSGLVQLSEWSCCHSKFDYIGPIFLIFGSQELFSLMEQSFDDEVLIRM